MNLNKKIVFGSVASILALGSVVPIIQNSNLSTVSAKSATITLNHNSYIYSSNGKRTNFNGKKTLKTGTVVNSNGKISTINGKNYYSITNNAYIKASNVGMIDDQVQKGNLQLNYNSFVYDKNGKRLSTYRGSKSNTHIKKGTPLKYATSIEPVDRNSKHFYLLNDDGYNQSWLPYEKIGNKYYYNIGAGGYINASNVDKIDNKPLYTTETSVTIENSNIKQPFTIGTGKDKTEIQNGKTYNVDRITGVTADPSSLTEYRISGTTDAFISSNLVKTRPRQRLEIYTYATYVSFNKSTSTYDAHGKALHIEGTHSTFNKNDKYPVEDLTYIWIPEENKAELFYLLQYSWTKNGIKNSIPGNFVNESYQGLIYVKASDVNYCSGPYLKPDNSPEQAKADANVAKEADKKELQNLISQENTIVAYKKNNVIRFCDVYYSYALKFAKSINDSNTASIAEVKKATSLLSIAQKAVINSTPEQDQIDNILINTNPYLYIK